MSGNFNTEIISPDKTILKTKTKLVTIPSYEGLMGILKDHIPLVTFLRPGIIELVSEEKDDKYFIEEGTVEFFNNNLLILTSSCKLLSNFSGEEIQIMIQNVEKEIVSNNLKDKQRYILSHKLETLKEIRQ